jgi:methylmalonyl-CoA mutase cobalamin-binding subunit
MPHAIRVFAATPGFDGHPRDAKVIASTLEFIRSAVPGLLEQASGKK